MRYDEMGWDMMRYVEIWSKSIWWDMIRHDGMIYHDIQPAMMKYHEMWGDRMREHEMQWDMKRYDEIQ